MMKMLVIVVKSEDVIEFIIICDKLVNNFIVIILKYVNSI